MKKILLPFDGIHFSESAFDFAKKLHEKNPILLTGVFLPQISYANVWSYADGMGGPLFVPALEESDKEVIEKNIEKFEELCERNQIEFRVRKDFTDLAMPELKKETRFADLMIISGQSFYENMGSGDPNIYLRDALHDIECPAIVVPDHYTFPSNIILSYDGSESSVFAIKQFVYLLPELSECNTMLIYVTTENGNDIPKEPYIEEYLTRHIKDLTISKLDMDPRKYFSKWIADKKSSLLISGSFSRSAVSSLFRKSFVLDIIKEHKIPVFIAHK